MRNDKTMPKDWVKSPLTKWLVDNNVSLHKFTVGTNLSPNVIYTLVRGQTLNPADKTIQKVCAFTGLTKRQMAYHKRVVREMRTSVDKSVVSRGTARRISASKPSLDELTFTITVKASDIPEAVRSFLR